MAVKHTTSEDFSFDQAEADGFIRYCLEVEPILAARKSLSGDHPRLNTLNYKRNPCKNEVWRIDKERSIVIILATLKPGGDWFIAFDMKKKELRQVALYFPTAEDFDGFTLRGDNPPSVTPAVFQ